MFLTEYARSEEASMDDADTRTASNHNMGDEESNEP